MAMFILLFLISFSKSCFKCSCSDVGRIFFKAYNLEKRSVQEMSDCASDASGSTTDDVFPTKIL